MADDRFKATLVQFIRDAVPTAFLRIVRARVVAVDGAAVDTDPETPGTPQLTGITPRYGLPGVLRAVCTAGARAVVAWAEGDPSQPFVLGWDPGQLEELVFDVPGGSQPLGRTGDEVDCGSLAFATIPAAPPGTVTSTLTVTYTPPGGGAPSTVQVQGLPPTLACVGAIALSGRLTGSSRVKA